MQTKEKVFYLRKNIRRMAWVQLAVILGLVFAAILSWTLVIALSVDDIIRTGLAFLTLVVMLALSPLLLQSISHLVSRMKISEIGLDYLFWPYYHISCSWVEVDSITRRKEIVVEADVLLLKSAIELGLPLVMRIRKRMGLPDQYFIPLNLWDGWPSGELADTLRHYAPFLFGKNLIPSSP